MADQSEVFARYVGVSNQYTIERMSNLNLHHDSRVVISASNMGQRIDTTAVVNSAVQGMQPYFSSVYSLVTVMPLEQAKIKAKTQYHGDLLFHLTLVDADKQKPKESEEDKESESYYKNITLVITVIDVNSGNVFDKIQLKASDKIIPFTDESSDDLLLKPFSVMAKNITGAK
jgi:hypothetical protein